MKLRNYDYIIVGDKKVDLKKSLEILKNKYNIKKILTDTGRILGNILLNSGLVNEISLLIHPVIVGKKGYNIFSDVDNSIEFDLIKKERIKENYIWTIYRVR